MKKPKVIIKKSKLIAYLKDVKNGKEIRKNNSGLLLLKKRQQFVNSLIGVVKTELNCRGIKPQRWIKRKKFKRNNPIQYLYKIEL